MNIAVGDVLMHLLFYRAAVNQSFQITLLPSASASPTISRTMLLEEEFDQYGNVNCRDLMAAVI